MKTTGRSKQTLEMHPSYAAEQLNDVIEYMRVMDGMRLNRTLRENISQTLAAARIFIGLLEPSDGHQQLIKDRTAESLTLAVEEIKNLSDESSGSYFRSTGLIDSISTLIDEIGMIHFDKIRFTCHTHDIEQLHSYHKIILYKVIRESLQTIAADRAMKEVDVSLQFTPHRIGISFQGTLLGRSARSFAKSQGMAHVRKLICIYKGNTRLTTVSQGNRLEISIPLTGEFRV